MTRGDDGRQRCSAVEQANALAALRNLAEDDADTQALIAEAGGIPPLVARLEHGDDAQKAFAAGVLWHLSASAAYQVAIAEAGGIPPLVALARDGDNAQRENATGTLMKLAETRANQALIAKAGGVAVLLACIQDEPDEGAVSDAEGAVVEGDIARGSEEEEATVVAAAADAEDSSCLVSTVEGADAADKLHETEAVTEVKRLKELDAVPAAKSVEPDNLHEMEAVSEAEKPMEPDAAQAAKPVKASDTRASKPVGADGTPVVKPVEPNDTPGVRPLETVAIPDVDLVKAVAKLNAKHADTARSASISSMMKQLRNKRESCHTTALSRLLVWSKSVPRARRIVDVGGVPTLVAYLRDGSGSQRVLAAKTLKSISTQPHGHFLLAKAGVFPPLVAMIRLGRCNEKLEATMLLERLVETYAENQVAAAEAGSIPALITLLQDRSDDLKTAAVGALRNLAANCSNQTAISSAGGIAPLVELIRSGTDAQRTTAASVLARVVSSSASRRALHDAAGIPALVKLLLDDDEAVKLLAVTTLHTLADSKEERAAIVDAHGITQLTTLVRAGTDALKLQAIKVLRCLAVLHTHRAGIIADGALPLLKELLSNGSCELREAASSILSQLTAPPTVNRLMPDDTTRAHAVCPQRRGVIDPQSVDSTSQLMLHGEVVGASIDDIPALIELIQTGSDKDKTLAADVLRRLAPVDSGFVVASCGGIAALIELVRGGSSAAKTTALTALETFALSSTNVVEITAASGVRVLYKMLRSNHEVHRTQTLRVLRNVFRWTKHTSGITPHDLVSSLLLLLRQDSLEQKQAALAALRALATSASYHSAIGGAGGTLVLVKLAYHVDNFVREEATRVLCKMIQSLPPRLSIAEAGGVWPLILATRDSEPALKAEAVTSLWCLIVTLRSRAAHEKLAVIPALVAVACSATEPTSSKAAAILAEMKVHESTKHLVAAASWPEEQRKPQGADARGTKRRRLG